MARIPEFMLALAATIVVALLVVVPLLRRPRSRMARAARRHVRIAWLSIAVGCFLLSLPPVLASGVHASPWRMFLAPGRFAPPPAPQVRSRVLGAELSAARRLETLAARRAWRGSRRATSG